MKAVEKASGWLFALGLAFAIVLAFNYLDVFIMMCFRHAGISTKIYRGSFAATAALANIIVFAVFFIVCKKIRRPVLQLNKIGLTDIVLVVIIAVGMLGFVETFIMVSDRISEYIKSLSDEMDAYRESVNRYSGVKEEAVPVWDTLIYLFSLCILVPIEEEMIFRGAIFGVLKRKMPPLFAILVTAAIFGVMHRVSIHTAYAVVCGMILTACYHFTENLIASVIMHSLFNILGSAIGDLLKLEGLGVASAVRNRILLNINVICILMMVPAGLAFFYLQRSSKKRRLKQAESVTSGE